jgi:hypothetical protein
MMTMHKLHGCKKDYPKLVLTKPTRQMMQASLGQEVEIWTSEATL